MTNCRRRSRRPGRDGREIRKSQLPLRRNHQFRESFAKCPPPNRSRMRTARLSARGSAAMVTAVTSALERHRRIRKRDSVEPVHDMSRLCLFASKKLPASWKVVEQVAHLDLRSRGRPDFPNSFDSCLPPRSLRCRLPSQPRESPTGTSTRWRCWAMPHRENPSSARVQRSAALADFARRMSLKTQTAHRPGPCRSRHHAPTQSGTLRWRNPPKFSAAPASRLFSTSSLTREDGRSTTSPAATWLATSSGNRRIFPTTWNGAAVAESLQQKPKEFFKKGLASKPAPFEKPALPSGLGIQAKTVDFWTLSSCTHLTSRQIVLKKRM